MKTKHFTLFFLTVFLLGYILFILYFFTSLQVVKNDIRQKQCLALKETIEEDYQMRLKQVSLIDWSKGNQKKIKTYNKASKEGVLTFTFKDSVDASVATRLGRQSILAKLAPIIPDSFSALYRKNIGKYNIYGKSGTVYTKDGQKQYSGNDSISMRSAVCTHIMALDLERTMTIQAWTVYNWNTWLRYIPQHISAIFIVYSLAIPIVLVLIFRKKRKANITEEEEDIRLGSLLLKKETQKIYIGNKEYPIKALDFKLLLALIQAPEMFLDRESIRNLLWPKESIDATANRIDSHISALRKIIAANTEFQIITERGKGYRLENKKGGTP